MTEYEWNHPKWGIAYGAAILVMALVGFWLASTEPTPVVQKTWPGGECVMVLPLESNYTCNRLPPRYEVEWVAPRRK